MTEKFDPDKPSHHQTPPPSSALAKQTPASSSRQSLNFPLPGVVQPVTPTFLARNRINPVTSDIIRQSYRKLSIVMDEETLYDTALIVMDLNSKLQSMNQSIDQKLTPAVEELFMLQRLFPDTASSYQFGNISAAHFSSDGFNQNNGFNESATEAVSIEKPTGIMGFLLDLPHYFFDLKKLSILLICFLLLAGVMKVLHFVLNRIY